MAEWEAGELPLHHIIAKNAAIFKVGAKKQTGIYFLIISLIMLPIAYFSYRMEHSVTGFLTYFGIFIMIFAAMWLSQFMIAKRNIQKINAELSKKRSDGKE